MNQLVWTEQGSGPPLLLLHASPLSGAMWQEPASRLSRAHRVIVPDLPGFGRSPRLAAPTIAGMARAALSLLETLAVREPVIVGGLSIGGYVALELHHQAPDRVRALGLFATRATPDTEAIRQTRARTAARIRAEGAHVLLETLPRLLGRTTLAERPAVVEQVTRWVRAAEPQGLADAQLAMASRADATPWLTQIAAPVLVIAGAEDGLIPLAETEAMARAIPQAALMVLPAAGHLVSLETPAPFCAAVDAWCAQLPALIS